MASQYGRLARVGGVTPIMINTQTLGAPRSDSDGGGETIDISILRNKLTLELMSHAMAIICFNLYPNGVNSWHLTTLNVSLPPTLFPSVNIYRYWLSAALLCRE